MRILEEGGITLYHGDCRAILPTLDPVDAVITDPPYGDTSLTWDRALRGWLDLLPLARGASVWMFGSLRSYLAAADELATWKLAQDIVWEKHNGSGSASDRFRRVHEHAIHLYRGEWSQVYRKQVVTMDATKHTVRRKKRPPHWGEIGPSSFESDDGGPRLMRSVMYRRSEHGRAVHPTQKPLGILTPLIEHSCRFGGVVLDPFAGSGSTLLAARLLGMRAIGIELDERYAHIAAERLQQLSLLTEVPA